MARRLWQANGNHPFDISGRYLLAAEEYFKALAIYPKGDENHAYIEVAKIFMRTTDGETVSYILGVPSLRFPRPIQWRHCSGTLDEESGRVERIPTGRGEDLGTQFTGGCVPVMYTFPISSGQGFSDQLNRSFCTYFVACCTRVTTHQDSL
jgi:hypothetical protein